MSASANCAIADDTSSLNWAKRVIGNVLIRHVKRAVPAYRLPGSVGLREVLAAPGIEPRLEVAVRVVKKGPVEFGWVLAHVQSPSNTGVCLATKA